MAVVGPEELVVQELAVEALCIRNFLEDYWQFNEIEVDKIRLAQSPKPTEHDPFRVVSSNRYFSGYGPHSFASCAKACQVPCGQP